MKVYINSCEIFFQITINFWKHGEKIEKFTTLIL